MTETQTPAPADSAACALTTLPWQGVVRLHVLDEPSEPVLGIELPGSTGGVVKRKGLDEADNDCSALCLRPREWLLISESMDSAALLGQLEPVVDNRRCSLLDASHGLRRFRLQGPAAPWLLAKLSGLDFVGGAYREEHCATTRMGHAAVTVYHHRSGSDWMFDLLVDRSLSKYLEMLIRASVPHAIELQQVHGI